MKTLAISLILLLTISCTSIQHRDFSLNTILKEVSLEEVKLPYHTDSDVQATLYIGKARSKSVVDFINTLTQAILNFSKALLPAALSK